ncbi:MAG TPA: hypothetical protein VK797_24225 [Tepidisphaeraceae bacterium]|nr:hypothetical protein [Tepidisphaeraceae bacterium]
MSIHLPHKLAGLAAVCVLAIPAGACGPFFPNQLLFNSGQAVTWAPVADFHREMMRILPPRPAFAAVRPENGDAFDQSVAIDVAELSDALARRGEAERQRRAIVEEYQSIRQRLAGHARDAMFDSEKGVATRPAPLDFVPPRGLPKEFEQYLLGLIRFEQGNVAGARAAWQSLLDLPAAQRPCRTVWAQFMMGKSYLHDDSARAVEAFSKVRQLVAGGQRDSLGLASASFGWEAKAELDQQHYAQAMGLYLQQLAGRDQTAISSLAAVCAEVFQRADTGLLSELARDPNAARVLTGYTLAQGGPFREGAPSKALAAWLAAVESSGLGQVVGTERLAWAAYQRGDMSAAQRWVAKAPSNAPLALWVRAKLLLRAGKMDAAAAMLARAAHAFPEDEAWAGVSGSYEPEELSSGATLYPHRRAMAELGTLELARGNYVDALDELLRAGWWLDAAYVAERVLTPDELIAYVERNCPEGSFPQLRHLLARRLTRIGRWKQARPYFPMELRPVLDQYIGAIRKGHDKTLAASARAESLWQAAQIARWSGMDLLGTELAPDGFENGGSFQNGTVPTARRESKDELLPPLADELRRSAQSAPQPARRWHYRYTAADHAWAAALLMPSDTDVLASVLCEAGGWLKGQDPGAADRFYKALVTRCPHTELGRQAGKKKWFPETQPALTTAHG